MGRTNEFISGTSHEIQPGIQTNHWANQRYGDQKQLPAAETRRGGPLPFPETAEDHYRAVEEQERSHRE